MALKDFKPTGSELRTAVLAVLVGYLLLAIAAKPGEPIAPGVPHLLAAVERLVHPFALLLDSSVPVWLLGLAWIADWVFGFWLNREKNRMRDERNEAINELREHQRECEIREQDWARARTEYIQMLTLNEAQKPAINIYWRPGHCFWSLGRSVKDGIEIDAMQIHAEAIFKLIGSRPYLTIVDIYLVGTTSPLALPTFKLGRNIEEERGINHFVAPLVRRPGEKYVGKIRLLDMDGTIHESDVDFEYRGVIPVGA